VTSSRLALLALTAATLAIAACDRDAAGPDAPAGRYTLVSMGAASPPFAGNVENPDAPRVVCADTTFSHVIRLEPNGTGSLSGDQKVYCPGQAPRSIGGSTAATWSGRGDSVWIRMTVVPPSGPPISSTWNGALEGDRLVFRYPIYTESDPNGASGLTYDMVYRRD
jgi:hypothetical protein